MFVYKTEINSKDVPVDSLEKFYGHEEKKGHEHDTNVEKIGESVAAFYGINHNEYVYQPVEEKTLRNTLRYAKPEEITMSYAEVRD